MWNTCNVSTRQGAIPNQYTAPCQQQCDNYCKYFLFFFFYFFTLPDVYCYKTNICYVFPQLLLFLNQQRKRDTAQQCVIPKSEGPSPNCTDNCTLSNNVRGRRSAFPMIPRYITGWVIQLRHFHLEAQQESCHTVYKISR